MGFLGFSNQQWVDVGISVAILVAAIVVVSPLIRFVLQRGVKRWTRATKTTLDDVLIKSLTPPLYWLVFVFTGQFVIERLDFLVEMFTFDLAELYFLLYFIIAFMAIWRTIVALFAWYTTEIAPKTESALDDQMLPFVRRVVMVLIAVIGGIILLGHFEIEVSGLVTTLGIGSLAIALAAQAALSDTISGVMIMLDRPFRIGDRIEIQALSTWGDVVDIGLRSTNIRTRDNRMVIVPNSVIAKSLVVNHSYPDQVYRIQIQIGIAYGTDIEYARKVLIDAVSKVEGLVPEKPVEALFLEFGDSALTFRVRWWIQSYVDTRRMFDKVNTAMYYALNEAQIEIPFPQREVHHKFPPSEVQNLGEVFGRK